MSSIATSLCPLYGAQLHAIEDVPNPDIVRNILSHLEQLTSPYSPPARAILHGTFSNRFVETFACGKNFGTKRKAPPCAFFSEC